MTTPPPPRTFHSYEPRQGHGLPHDPFNAIVGPRPIGWISTQNAAGALNLAPYSFFTAFNYVPPIVGFASIGAKDTLRNIEATGEFVWNLAPVFPKYVLLLPLDAVLGLLVIVVVCTLASVMAIRAALKVDPAEAIGG